MAKLSDLIGKLSNLILFMVSSAEYGAIRIYNSILCSDAHEGGKYIFKKGPKTHKIQDGGIFTLKFKKAAIFVKL